MFVPRPQGLDAGHRGNEKSCDAIGSPQAELATKQETHQREQRSRSTHRAESPVAFHGRACQGRANTTLGHGERRHHEKRRASDRRRKDSAGVFLVGAMFGGWGIDGKTPDRFDFIGAAITMVGVVIVLFERRIFA